MNPDTADTSTAPHVVTKKAVTGWVLYDLANTIFAMGVTTLLFPLYVRGIVGEDKVDGVFSKITAVSMGTIFILSPLLGAMTDRAPRRMPFLLVSTLICILLTMTLGTINLAISATCYILANIAYQAGTQFYDALLPEVSNETNRGKIGGLGVGIGYLGSYIAVVVTSLEALNNPTNYPLQFTIIAVLFLLFSLPCLFFVKERGNPNPRPFGLKMAFESLQQTVNTLKDSKRYPGLGRFLIGRVFYTDPINTVMIVMVLFTMNVALGSGLGEEAANGKAKAVMAFAITFAIAGGLLWGRLADKIGPKLTLNIVLSFWMFNFILGFCIGVFSLPLPFLYVLAASAGLSLGGVWSADRPYMLRLTPPDRIGEFYGLYGMVGRFSAITGPMVWAASTSYLINVKGYTALKSQGISMLFLLAMMIVGFIILQKVDDKPRDWEKLRNA
ncbi:MAG: major facilitator superfamily 1 [Verrucomicrobia bacterium]|jgi:UMF1 family MFS transporter|nr:major facilitator superfamily 1 [Verrucomicrobiota bacterium]